MYNTNPLQLKQPGRINLDGKSPKMSFKLLEKRNNSSLKYNPPSLNSMATSPSGRKLDLQKLPKIHTKVKGGNFNKFLPPTSSNKNNK